MPEEIYKKTYDLRDDLIVGRIEVEYLLALLEKRGLQGVLAHFEMGEERTLVARNIEEISGVGEKKFAEFTQIEILADLANAEVSVHFYPVPKDDYALNYTLASRVDVKSSDIELIYMIKAIWDMFYDQISSAPPNPLGLKTLGSARLEAFRSSEKKAYESRIARSKTKAEISNQGEKPAEQGEKPAAPATSFASLRAIAAIEDTKQDKNKTNGSVGTWTAAILALTALIGIPIALRECGNGSEQVKAQKGQTEIARSQANHDNEALFKLSRKEGVQDTKSIAMRALPMEYELENVGRGAAQKITFQCGRNSEHGPWGELGTIAPSGKRPFRLLIVSDTSDLLHRRDFLCDQELYFTYEDGTGSHTVQFDGAGNVQTVEKSSQQ